MATDLENLMINKSDDGLQAYLDNRKKYTTEAVEAAVAEMLKRGKVFSVEELSSLRSDLKAQEDAREKKDKEVFGKQWEDNVVTDDDAPAYYSVPAIYIFSAFFSVIFGAILMAINLRHTEAKKGVWEVIAFSILFTGIQLGILSVTPRTLGVSFPLSLAGALLMNHLFWNKYIGNEKKYKAKSIWVPLFIGLMIFGPWLLLITSIRPN